MNFLAPPFSSHWQNKELFKQVCRLEGEVFREVKSRRTLRFKFLDKHYFAKIHFGIGWREVLKDIGQFRLPIVSAKNEWNAIAKLNQLEIDTMTPAAFSVEGVNPAKIRSFIITEELEDTVDLEEYCKDWGRIPPAFRTKFALIKKIAHISRTMHQAGMCHRDYYLCHFHLHRNSINSQQPRLSLIDLHRALIKTRLAKRWLVKDIAGLYFSAMEAGLTKRDRLRFMSAYMDLPTRVLLRDSLEFWDEVNSKALKLYAKEKRSLMVAK